METPNYIKSLLIPSNGKKRARRVWGIDLELVWLPFLTATNTQGDTAIPADALGAPLRLGYNADGSVKFSKTGRPVTKVAKDIADSVRLVRDNFTAGLLAYANGVITDNPKGYERQLKMAEKAGKPIVARDKANLDKALAEAREQAIASAMAETEAKPEVKEPAEVTA